MSRDILIIGQGLAGSLLWWRLHKAGLTADVLNTDDPAAASRVAPGIVNPLAGLRFNPSWRVDECLPCAIETYQNLGQELGEDVFVPRPIVRLLKNTEQKGYLQKRLLEPLARSLITEFHPPHHWPACIADEYGSFSTARSGHLRLMETLQALRGLMQQQGCYHDGALKEDDLSLLSHSVTWNGRAYRAVILCEGWRAAQNRWFAHLPWRLAKGETLFLETRSRQIPDVILNRGQWLLPLGEGRYWSGSTYDWDRLDTRQTAEAEAALRERLSSYVKVDWKVTAQKAGIRPILHDYKPVLGPHPQHPALYIFNGLGSKGVLNSPWCSLQLAAHLTEGRELPSDSLPSRFRRKSA